MILAENFNPGLQLQKKLKDFFDFAEKLSIQSDEFIPSPEFRKFPKLAPLPRGTLRNPAYNPLIVNY
jgi:hypothetical protein